MTEFQLRAGFKLGLIPEHGIARILLPSTPAPDPGIPRCELYLRGPGAAEGMEDRDWGDRVADVVELDGHVLAFAEPTA